jgi:hypothetical protein
MSTLTDIGFILHNIRIKLYPNYLQNTEGAFFARTNSEKTLSAEDICVALKTRGGFMGNLDDLLDNIRQYNDEVAYQLCDGFAVTNGYYTIHPNIGGTFKSVGEAHDHKKHPIGFRFGTRAKLRNLVKHITVEVEGIADTAGYIDTFTDNEEDSVNGLFMPGNIFALHGNKIKIAGEDPDNGVYFVPEDVPSMAVKVDRIAENSASKITGIAPDTGHVFNRIEVRTQYNGSSSSFLKSPRAITAGFIIESAA